VLPLPLSDWQKKGKLLAPARPTAKDGGSPADISAIISSCRGRALNYSLLLSIARVFSSYRSFQALLLISSAAVS
jgi:hypothetical protein